MVRARAGDFFMRNNNAAAEAEAAASLNDDLRQESPNGTAVVALLRTELLSVSTSKCVTTKYKVGGSRRCRVTLLAPRLKNVLILSALQ